MYCSGPLLSGFHRRTASKPTRIFRIDWQELTTYILIPEICFLTFHKNVLSYQWDNQQCKLVQVSTANQSHVKLESSVDLSVVLPWMQGLHHQLIWQVAVTVAVAMIQMYHGSNRLMSQLKKGKWGNGGGREGGESSQQSALHTNIHLFAVRNTTWSSYWCGGKHHSMWYCWQGASTCILN